MGPHRLQPTRLHRPWDSPGNNTGVGCHFLLQYMKVKVKLLSRVQPSVTPWTAALQAPPSMGFSRQEYWSGVPLPSPPALWGWANLDLAFQPCPRSRILHRDSELNPTCPMLSLVHSFYTPACLFFFFFLASKENVDVDRTK